MDKADLRIRAQKKCKFFSEVVTNIRFYGKLNARKQLVLTHTDIRT